MYRLQKMDTSQYIAYEYRSFKGCIGRVGYSLFVDVTFECNNCVRYKSWSALIVALDRPTVIVLWAYLYVLCVIDAI